MNRRIPLLLSLFILLWPLSCNARTELVSVSSSGEKADDLNLAFHDISGSGRYVVFDTPATNLDPNDNTPFFNVFLRDTLTKTTEFISSSSSGEHGNSGSMFPTTSHDGRFVVFSSHASNLIANDTNNLQDIFLKDRANGTVTCLTISSTGEQANDYSDSPHISDSGNYVVFESRASNLVSGDTNGAQDIFIYSRITSTLERVSVSSAGLQANSLSHSASVSGDDRFVVFSSLATNLDSNDTSLALDVYLRDRLNQTTKCLSCDSGLPLRDGYAPDISEDGRYVVYEGGHDFAPGAVRNDIFLYEISTGITTLVNVSEYYGEQADTHSARPKISANGRYVVFESEATNLDVSFSGNGYRNIFLKDIVTDTLHLVSRSKNGQSTNSDSFYPKINGDGGVIAINSTATNLLIAENPPEVLPWSQQLYRIDLIDDRQPHTSPILRTQQDRCFDSSGTEIPSCEDSGQDKEYQAGLMIDLYPDTVVSGVTNDHTTGLGWQDNYQDNKGYATANTIPYLKWQEAVDYCDAIDLGAYTDWRLPSLQELATLMRFNNSTTALDTEGFLHYQNDAYWSSTEYKPGPANAWGLFMNTGADIYGLKSNQYMYVRCVRGNSFTPFFEKSDNGVRDEIMQLEWQDTADILSNQHNWQQAIDYCENLKLNGSGRWRLPTTGELRSIVDYKRSGPATRPEFTHEQSHAYWSGTTDLSSTNSAWVLFSQNGSIGKNFKTISTYKTRCVRSLEKPLHITKTGQLSCYDSSGQEISCLESHQDGEYQTGLERVYDRNDFRGTVYDSYTELTWQDQYDNLPTGQLVKTGDWVEAVEYCNELDLGGYRNWRLPNRHELTMLLDRSGDEFSIDPTFQAKVRYMNWWASSTYAGNNLEAWRVYFNGQGSDNHVNKTVTDTAIRCVRGESFLHNSWGRKKEIVTDYSTRLQWQDNQASATMLSSWTSALDYCDNLVLGSLTDWRLPNINELHSLVDTSQINPALTPLFRNVRPEDYGDYWSSTSSEPNSPGSALAMDFSTGDDFSTGKYTSLYTRCVRGPAGDNPADIIQLLQVLTGGNSSVDMNYDFDNNLLIDLKDASILLNIRSTME